ncbi:ankyrin repeat-containing domain protein [Podospora aff. communis PSN243]|uniref:Ankyrin repeat-containing domain protein n=1 Tax=Podospora aff. communis PSN243 TaxID=3040156 RepID=A0AAV9GQI7_9PEZI|nr:ankyrin repeat-containing domain protein [Podospora aff. communis PSN243]
MDKLFAGQRFHLILVHGIGDDKSRQRKVWSFWSARFRGTALVTSFPFVEENSFSSEEKRPSLRLSEEEEHAHERNKTIDFGSLGFAGRAQALLDKIVEADAKAGVDAVEGEGQPSPFVYIFLSHDLGGSLVQQALDLASHHRRYLHIANYTAGLVFCERPSGVHVEEVSHREDEILRIASKRQHGSRLPFGVLRDFPCDLDSIAWSYEGIKRHYPSLDVTSEEGQVTTFRAGEAVARERQLILNIAHLDVDVWRVEPGHVVAEQVFDFIKRILVTEIRYMTKAYRRFLTLLSSVSAASRQLRLSKPSPSTLSWVAKHPSYRDWMVRNVDAPDILYLSGPRGSGRSVIASHLIAALQDVPNSTVISFSYDKQDQRTQPLSAFYISLIRQILFTRPLLFRLIASVADWVKNEDAFGYEVLTGMFLSLVKGASPNPVYCVIYGAEDCREYEFDGIITVIRRFRAMTNGQANFKLVVSDNQPRKGLFQLEEAKCRDIDLSGSALYCSDVQQYIQNKVNKLALRHPEWETCRRHVVEKICSADPTFLQASFSTRLLETAKIPSTMRAVERVVDGLPWTVDEMYESAVKRCASDIRTPLMPLLRWIAYSVRPLNLDELAVVPALSVSKELSWEILTLDTHLRIAGDIRPLKGNLVKPSGLQVLPIHSSLEPALAKLWAESGEDPEIVVFEQCLNYLELALQHLPDIANSNPTSPTDLVSSEKTDDRRALGLFGYAATHWPYHYRRVRDRLSQDSRNRVVEFVSAGTNSSLLYKLHELYAGKQSKRFPPFNTPLQLASRHGLVGIVRSLLQTLRNTPEFKDALGKALDLAAGYNHKDVVDVLLQEGAPCVNALCLASKNNFFDIVKTLVGKRPEAINNKDDEGRSPFLLAALNGNETIGAYLLGKGAKVAVDDTLTNKSTAIHVAARTGQSKVMQLINSDFDLEALDQWDNDALLLAAEGGFDDVVRILLERKVSLNRKNDKGFTALHRAVAQGQVSTCDVLLDAGVDIFAKSHKGFSPIHLAAQGGHLRILKRLLERLGDEYVGTAIEESTASRFGHGGNSEDRHNPDGEARPPLELAALYGHLDTMKELLKHPRFNSALTQATALMLAAAHGWDLVVGELLNRSSLTAVVRNEDGFDALHVAAKYHYPHIITKILDSPKTVGVYDVNSVTTGSTSGAGVEGWTPLHIAAEGGRFLTVRELLARKANAQALTSNGETPLHIAAAFGWAFITDELLKALAQLRLENDRHPLYLEDDKGRTPFVRAVEKGQKDVAVVIEKFVRPIRAPAPGIKKLSTGSSSSPIADILKLQGQKDALYLAVASNDEGLVQFLIGSGWDPNARNAVGPNGLHLAASSASPFRTSMLEILLGAGADPNAKYPDTGDEDAAITTGSRPLHIAVKDSRLDAIETLLNKRADINATDDLGITPLYLAAYLGKLEVVQELLRWKPNLEIKNITSGWTALHAAFDNAKIVKLLLDEGANPYALTDNGRPAYFMSADEADGEAILRIYLDHPNAKVDPNWRMRGGWTVLHAAAGGGTVGALRLLLERGADINAADDATLVTPLHTVLAQGKMDAIEFLLSQQEANLNADCYVQGTVLMTVADRKDDGQAVRLVLSKGVDVNATSEYNGHFTALQRAAHAGDEDAVEALLEAGADANLTGGKDFGSPLLAAIMGGRKHRLAITKRLLDAGAEVNFAGSANGTALEWALAHGRQEIVKLLLEKERKADVNAISKNERLGTPLIAAVDAGEIDSIKALLERGADPNLTRAADTETPAQVAVRRGRLNVLETLVKHGADLGYTGPLRRRVLSHAIGWKSTDLLDLLWDCPEVDINEQDVETQTPLMIAAREGDPLVVEKLIARGANCDAQDRLGRTALMHAVCKDYGSIVTTLVDKGRAKVGIQDKHGRDALYLAARRSGTDVFHKILKSTESDGAAYERAIMAAIASNRPEIVTTLLDRLQRLTGKDRDGWTALYTAQRYQRDWVDVIEDVTPSAAEPDLKLPSEWDRNSLVCVSVDEDGKSLVVGRLADYSMAIASNSAESYRAVRGTVRANHPMVPVKDGVYYFEVKFTGVSGVGEIGVGFCEDHAETDSMLGHKESAWGYHGDDGRIFGVNLPYGPKYGEGDVIGCGVNFDEGTVFYTKNGTIIGRAFAGIVGKLYPAVCMNLRMSGCRVSATFWDEKDQGKSFKFKGSFKDPSTFEETEYAKQAVRRSETFGRDGRDALLRRKHSISDEDDDDYDDDSGSVSDSTD